MQKAIRLLDGPVASEMPLAWPADVEWPDELWADLIGDDPPTILLSPEEADGLHRYLKIRQSALSDEQVEGVRILRGAEYVYAPPVPPARLVVWPDP